jgi:cytochrome c556
MNLGELEQQYGLPPGLLAAVMNQESGGNPDAVSPKGAVGAFQFMPDTARQYGVDPTNPESSAIGAARMFADLSKKYGGDVPKMLAGYNWGQGNVDRLGMDRAPAETRSYVQKIGAKLNDPGMAWLRANAPANVSANASPPSEPQQADAGMDWLRAHAPQPTPSREDVQRAMLNRQIMGAVPFVGQYAPDVVMGGRQVLDAAAQMGARGLTAATSPDSAIGKWAREQQQSTEHVNQSALDAYRKDFQPDLYPGAGAARVGGQALVTAPALPLRAATGLVGAAAQGGGLGAVTSALTPVYDVGQGKTLSDLVTGNSSGDTFWQQKRDQAMQGAKIGALSGGGLNVLGRVISPNSSAAVQKLMDEGVTPTLGQTLGGVWKTAEEKAASLPIIGDAIRYAQGKGLDEFNRAIYNRVLAPLGEKYSGPIGQEGIAKVGDRLSSAYDDVLQKIPMVAVDQPFGVQTLQLQQMAKSLPPDKAQQLDRIVQNEVWNRLTPAGTLSGESMKQMESKLGQIARGYRGSPDFDQRQLGDAVAQIQANLRALVARQFPDQARTLQAVNQGWSQLTQLEKAANSTAAARNEGVVTPANYLKGIKQSDNSVRDRAFARGQVMNQDLAQAADKVLSNKYPDSGTAGRALFNAGAAGAGAFFTPHVLAGASAGVLPYLPGARQAVATLLARRPEIAGLLGAPLKQAAPYLGIAAPIGLPRQPLPGLLELVGSPDQLAQR